MLVEEGKRSGPGVASRFRVVGAQTVIEEGVLGASVAARELLDGSMTAPPVETDWVCFAFLIAPVSAAYLHGCGAICLSNNCLRLVQISCSWRCPMRTISGVNSLKMPRGFTVHDHRIRVPAGMGSKVNAP